MDERHTTRLIVSLSASSSCCGVGAVLLEALSSPGSKPYVVKIECTTVLSKFCIAFCQSSHAVVLPAGYPSPMSRSAS